MVRDCDQYSLIHDPANLLKYITIPSSVNLLAEDERSLVVGNIYRGKHFTGFASVLQ